MYFEMYILIHVLALAATDGSEVGILLLTVSTKSEALPPSRRGDIGVPDIFFARRAWVEFRFEEQNNSN